MIIFECIFLSSDRCVCVFVSGKDDVLDVEIDSYIHCISAFVKLALSEYALLTEIIPEHHQKKTFDSLIQVSVVCVFGVCVFGVCVFNHSVCRCRRRWII